MAKTPIVNWRLQGGASLAAPGEEGVLSRITARSLPGWVGGETVPTRSYQGMFAPSDLEILGTSTRWSPNRVVDFWLRRQLTRRWSQERRLASSVTC